MRWLSTAWVAWCALGCAAGGAAVPASAPVPPARPTALTYDFVVDASLDSLTARVCFRGAPPPELVCGERGGASRLELAELITPRGPRPLVVEDGRIQLADAPHDACMRYRVGLGEEGDRYGDAVLTGITEWLWRPSRGVRVGRVSAGFELPEGAAVSVPWPRSGESYLLDHTTFGFKAYAVFGRFQRETIQVPGGIVDVAILDGLRAETRRLVRPWLETAARASALVTGHLARKRVQVVVIPTGAGDTPVGFGQMTRGGGASAVIFLRDNARLEPLLSSWVAVHELTHLLHPFVQRDEAWLSEGIATYYQEVLRVRAGLLSEREAWQRMYTGALRGRAARQSLERESAEMYVSYDFPMVYWAGAAVALMADVELRSGARHQSLDSVLGELSRCCSRTTQPWSAGRVVERVDAIAQSPVLSTIVRAHVEKRPLPRVGPLLARLGVFVDGEDVRLDDDAELAGVRHAIMRVDETEAARVRELIAADGRTSDESGAGGAAALAKPSGP